MSPSTPNSRAELRFAGEIRFGPAYFELLIDGREIPNRIFGDCLQWSADGRFLVAQEWLTTDYGSGPITCAAVIDVANWKIARMKIIQKGFAEDFQFEKDALIYRENIPAKGKRTEVKITLSAISDWERIAG
ncbi:MAG: hypothetical protein RIR79_624 [Pseudomonadota bacterium]|jgi:hypothetical protein